jgi:hypothetical protein
VLTTGTATLGALTFKTGTTDVQVANAVIDLSGGAGTFKVSGVITRASAATTTPGTTSTWVFNGSVAQTIPMGTASNTFWGACTTQCYANVQILNTSAAGATLGNNAASGNISGNFTVGDGTTYTIYNNGAFTMAGASTKIFTVNNNASFKMTGTANNFPTGFTGGSTGPNTACCVFGATSTVEYNQTTAGFLMLGATTTFGNLSFKPASGTPAFTQSFTMTVAGDLTIGGAGGAPVVTLGSTTTFRGNLNIYSGSITTSTNINFTPTTAGTYTINSLGSSLGNMTFNAANTTWNILGSLSGTAMTVTAGTVLGSGNVTLTGSMTGNGTVIFGGDSDGANFMGMKQISTSKEQGCGVSFGGNAYCWGDGVNGGLGDNNTAAHTTGLPVRVLKGAAASADNDGHTSQIFP